MSRAEESKPHDTMTTAVRRIPAATAADPPFPDELLEQIFLHQDDAADLARACAACMSFRRVITARPFLRHFRTFRSLHKPPALGFLNVFGFHLVDPPHRMAPAVARAADFTFSFPPPLVEELGLGRPRHARRRPHPPFMVGQLRLPRPCCLRLYPSIFDRRGQRF
jgi:hypothetical protein